MEEVGFPKGTINLILGAGSEVGDVMSGHKELTYHLQVALRLVSILKMLLIIFTNIALELGGKIKHYL